MLLIRVLFFIATIFIILGCTERTGNEAMPEVLRIGILPDEGKAELLKRYTPLFEYLANKLGVTYTIIIPDNYQDLVNKFAADRVDLAYFGGFTFIKVHDNYDAVPLVMRDVDMRFTSYFIVRGDNPSDSLNAFHAKSISFGSKLSTSGHLMPRYFLKQKEIVPEEFFSKVEYSGTHDKTIYWVRDGKVDIGVANSRIFNKMRKDKRIKKNELRILLETPPYPDYVWALRAGFIPSVQLKIQNAFLSLSPTNPEHAKVLSGLDAGGFLPASISNFKQLHDISYELGLINSHLDN